MDARKIIDLQALFILVVAGGLSEQLIAATPTFERQVIDAAFAGDVKGIGDIDGDGLADLVIGGRQMYVYLYPNWTKRLVATANVEFTTDMQLGDVDSDGDLDIVTADGSTGNNVLWLENPRPNSSSTWARHVIGAHSSWAHDVEIGDLDRDGKIDVVTRGQNQTNLFFQNTPISWTRRDISAVMGFGEGMGIGDVNGDGYLDLAAAGAWIRSPANPRVGSWVASPIASYQWDTTAAVGDMNNDGRTDVLFAVQHGRGSLAWFEAPTDPVNGNWLRHVIDSNMGSHKLNLGDINRDGRLDVVAGLELAELSIYLSTGDSAFSFSKQVLSTTGLHNQRLGDVDNDGDLDIFGANYLDNPPVELWENTTSGSPPTDTTPPTVSITAPVSGSTVSGTVTVSASAADAGGVAGVQFRLDGVNLGAQDVTAPYSVAWNTATATAGSHTLTAQARDTAGNLASSTTVTVTVAAPADTTPPTVSITAPVSGSTVSGTVTVSASAADAGGVAGVQFRLDGVNLGAQDLTAPYSVAWNTATATAGSHTLTAQARDTAGNLASSTTITVTVATPADTTPPTVSITAPVSGSTVSGTVTVSASAADAGGVAGVQFRLDGVNLGAQDVTAPYSVAWNTVTATAGNHTLTAQARDTAGNLASSTTVTVTVAMLPGGGGGVTSNLIGHWRLDDGAGITAQDAAGSYPGSLRNGPLWVPGKSGQALSFDGADDFVDLGILNVSGSALTIAAWIKADSLATDEARIVSRAVGSAEQDHYFMLSTVDNGGIKLRFRLKTGTTTSTLLASTGTLAVGQWIHVAAVYDGSAMLLYKDGLEVGRLAKSGVLATDATARAAIGRNPQPYAPFDGTIDDVRLYARALTPAAIGELIELASLPPPDTTPPTVSITAPVSGSTVSGTVTVSASAADAGGVAGVQFRLDGVNLGTQDLTAPYSVAWNTATATAGSHTLTAQARDTAGNLASSTTVTVTVAAPADTTPPTVSITAPVSGSTVSGTVTVSASAADAGGVAGVQFRLDGVNLGAQDLTAPYSVAWNTATATAGSHTLTAQARDTAGNLASSTTVTVTVAMLPGGGGGVTSNLIGHWRLDDGAGITAQDAAGSYPGSLRNGPLWVPGKSGQALSFDGADDFVDLGILNVSGSALTIAAWIKADSFATDEARIVSRSVGSAEQDHYFMLSTVDNGGIKLRFRLKTGTTTSTLLASTGTLAVGQWIHVAAVYDGSAMVLYKDGLEVGRLAKTGVLATDATARAAIGRNPQPYAPFDGTIDDVRVYQRALSATDIQALAGVN